MKKPQIKFYKIVLMLIASLLLNSCKIHINTNDAPVQEAIDFSILLDGSQSNMMTRENTIITSQEQLNAVFETINSSQEPGEGTPKIDFSQYKVGMASMGEFSSGGYSITVDHIEKTKETLTIYLEEESPASGDNVTSVMTSPFVLFQFEKHSLPVVFRYISEKE